MKKILVTTIGIILIFSVSIIEAKAILACSRICQFVSALGPDLGEHGQWQFNNGCPEGWKCPLNALQGFPCNPHRGSRGYDEPQYAACEIEEIKEIKGLQPVPHEIK